MIHAIGNLENVNRDRAAKRLARLHRDLEESVTRVFRIRKQGESESNGAEPIRLLEVNQDTVAAGIMPLSFGPSPTNDVPYPSVIVEVTPEEFERIRMDELKLPEGWIIGEELIEVVNGIGD